MVIKEEATSKEHYFHFSQCGMEIGPRGGVKTNIISYRRNGKVKLWKKEPERFQLPVKHGFYGPCDYITEKNAHMWHTESDCPVMRELRERHDTLVQTENVSNVPLTIEQSLEDIPL